jgi:hypothetical protein
MAKGTAATTGPLQAPFGSFDSFRGDFFFPPLCTVRSTSRWSTEVSISSPPSSFRSLLCQPFVLSWWLHPLDAVRGGLGRERLDAPLTQTSYTARKAQRTIHGEMYAKGSDAPSDSLTMFSIHRWCTVCTFSQRESAQLFYFSPCPLAVSYHQSPFRVSPWTPADHLCVFSFLPLQKEKRQEKKRASGWLWGGLLAGSDFGNVSCCTHYVWSRVRF